ncbi:MAG: hypothetical protein LEGION0398_MBIBDBAK_00983 [Legionellaceae bacterium]
MIGVDVLDMDKKNIGEIKEIVLDKVSGQVRYVVLSFGGLLGLGDKYFAFQWKSIRYSPEDKSFILNVDKKLLKKEHGFDKDHWPDMAQWDVTVSQYYP